MEQRPISVFSDVGGVTFTFDKNKRKEIWTAEAGGLVKSVLEGGKVTDKYPGLSANPYSKDFGTGPDYNAEFSKYARGIAETIGVDTTDHSFAEQAGKQILNGMLINPTATALLEHAQGIALKNGTLKAKAGPGVKNLVDYVESSGGVFDTYSTGASKMPDQFHKAVGLDYLVGRTETTFPGHAAKERSAETIVKKAKDLKNSKDMTYNAFIDDNDNEIGIWADARTKMKSQGLGNPTLYLLKKDMSTADTGIVSTSKGDITVVNSLDQVRKGLSDPFSAYGSAYAQGTSKKQANYKVDFGKSDKKFG
ncbi:hypothetical protein ACFL96_02970 [Thermoproteota archaeon]